MLMSSMPQFLKKILVCTRKCAKMKPLGSEVVGDYLLPLFSTVSRLCFHDQEED